MEWPSYSPDLSAIEQAWLRLKDTIYKLDPDPAETRGSSEEVRKRFRELTEQAWEALGDDYFD
jgi:transposase